jgi:hypothetical protein
MEKIEQKLLRLKEAIAEEKSKKSKLEGALEQLEKDLKEKYGITSVKDADKKIKGWKVEIDTSIESAEEAMEKLEQLFEW